MATRSDYWEKLGVGSRESGTDGSGRDECRRKGDGETLSETMHGERGQRGNTLDSNGAGRVVAAEV